MINVFLKNWFYCKDQVRLIYSDCSELFILREVFERSFLTIISSNKFVILRDFKSYLC